MYSILTVVSVCLSVCPFDKTFVSKVFYLVLCKCAHYFIIIIIKQNWNQFLLVVQATAIKQQISKFYSQVQRTDTNDHITSVSDL